MMSFLRRFYLRSAGFARVGMFSLAMAFVHSAVAQTSFTSTSVTGAWNTARWNNSADSAPYTSTFTANNHVSFTSGTYAFAGMGAATNVGNVTLADNVTVNFSASSRKVAR